MKPDSSPERAAIDGEIVRLRASISTGTERFAARVRLAALLFVYETAATETILAVLHEVLRDAPRNGAALYWAACVRFHRHEATHARDLTMRAIAACPDQPEYYLLLVSTLSLLNAPSDEIMVYARRAIELAPTWPRPYLVYASALISARKYRVAEEHILAALTRLNSITPPADPLEFYFEVTETGRLGLEEREIRVMLDDVRRATRATRSLSN